MDIGKSESIQVKEENVVYFHEIIDNNIKTEVVKVEPLDEEFIKCELCIESPDGKSECVHRNDRLEDDKLQVLGSYSTKDLQTNGSHKELKLKVDKTECCSVQEQDYSTIKLDTEITLKEEDQLDSPEYVSTNVEGEDKDNVFNEDEDIEEPTDTEASSHIMVKDTDNNEDIEDGLSDGLQNDDETKQYRCPKREDEMNKATFQCKVCSIIFPVRSSSDLHEKNHTTEYPLITHENTHIGEKRHYCNACPKSFIRRDGLVQHQRTHTGEKPYNCKICEKSYTLKSYIVRHERTHTGEKPYKCKVCAKPISEKSNVVKHEKTHTGEKPYNCRVCSKRFSEKYNLKMHEKIHIVGEPLNCKICSKRFSEKSNLKMHEKSHTALKCKICSEPFSSNSHLERHEKMHTVPKSIQCKVCSKSFSQRNHLLAHERTHAKKLFHCKVCTKSFTMKKFLVRHEEIHTGENQSNICSEAYKT